MEPTKQKLLLILGGSVAGGGLLLYFAFYLPLATQIKVRGSECRVLEAEVAQARKSITALKKEGLGKSFLKEEDISPALDELIRQGKLQGVKFSSLAPKAAERPTGSAYRILPIEMETESSYESLGGFLGSLDEMERSLVTVKEFEAAPAERNPSRVEARLTVQMYLAD